MSTLAVTPNSFRRVAENLRQATPQPPHKQVAALCYRAGVNGPEVLLITSRQTGRWIIPKGWPMARQSAHKTARMEAFEEAGVIGKAGKQPLGEFASHKGLDNGFKVKTMITVYPIKAERLNDEFPEKGERELVWLPLEEAAERCNEEGLRQLLLSEKVRTMLNESV